jgi:hypothetical protein
MGDLAVLSRLKRGGLPKRQRADFFLSLSGKGEARFYPTNYDSS